MPFARKVRMELERSCIKWYVRESERERRKERGREKRGGRGRTGEKRGEEGEEGGESGNKTDNITSWMDDQRLEAGSDWRADIGNGILAARLIGILK
jgi:hypothetical protein